MKIILQKIISKFKNTAIHNSETKDPIIDEVEKYYDEQTTKYLSTYGKIIQAARPSSDIDFIKYTSENIGLKDGMKVLDAGCGVCGPAVEFAKIRQLNIEAITISNVQVIESKKNINENNLKDSINVIKGDFSELNTYYPNDTFDKIYFLETLGYANNHQKVIKSAVSVLKKGGSIYIKDFFLVPLTESQNKIIQDESNKKIRDEYLYKVLNIVELINTLRDLGLYIEFIKPFAMKEDFTKAASFELLDNSHTIYTKGITSPFQLYEVLEVKFKKI